MNAQEVCLKLDLLGLRGDIRRTGHPHYVRVFVIDRRGVTQGRMTIFQGAYSHCKWYVRKIHTGRVLPDEYYPAAWGVLLQQDRVLSRQEWQSALKEAKRLAKARYEEKLAWREANPHPQGKQRRALERPNPRSFLNVILYGRANETA